MNEQRDSEWWSVAVPAMLLWRAAATREGAVAVCALSWIAGFIWSGSRAASDGLVVALTAPVLAYFALVVLNIISMVGDTFACWASAKLLRKPDPSRATHQALHLLLSAVGFGIGYFFLAMGDGLDNEAYQGYRPR